LKKKEAFDILLNIKLLLPESELNAKKATNSGLLKIKLL